MRFTITKVEQDPRGFWTAHVSDGESTVTVDSRIGIWSTPRDPHADHGRNDVTRGEVIPEVAARLRARVRAAERGEAQDESDVMVTLAKPAPPRKTFRDVDPPRRSFREEPKTEYADHSAAQRIAEQMAAAGAAAVRRAA
jgi:hypothetical protein